MLIGSIQFRTRIDPINVNFKGFKMKLKRSVKITKLYYRPAVDDCVYAVCKANGHLLATVNQYGEKGKPIAEFIRDAINISIRKTQKC